MKILSLAIASLAASVASAGGVRKLNKKDVSPRLMKNSMKYSEFKKKNKMDKGVSRKLDEFEITGKYSIIPQDCLSFKVDAEDMYDEDIVAFSANGQAWGEKSYMIFQVVETENAYYEDGSDDGLYICELNEFMAAAGAYKFAIKEAYCEQCNEFEDYCLYGGNQNQEGDEGRKLYGNFINCKQCDAYDCWEDQNGNDADDPDEIAAEKVMQIAECMETGLYAELNQNNNRRKLNDEAIELKAGYMCGNSKGGGKRGPEIALFLDDDCTIHYKNGDMDYYNSYANVGWGNNNNAEDMVTESMLEIMEQQITYPWNTTGKAFGIDCEAFPEFDDPYENNGNNNNDNQYEANEVCQEIMGQEAVPLYNCGQDQNEEEEEEEQEEREGNYYNFNYEAEISENVAEDIGLVCKYYKEYDVENDYVELYEGETHFKPEKAKAGSGGGLSTGGKWAIAVVVLAAVGGAAYFFTQKKKSGDSKLEPLSGRGGTSA